jgi:hypothetical protein
VSDERLVTETPEIPQAEGEGHSWRRPVLDRLATASIACVAESAISRSLRRERRYVSVNEVGTPRGCGRLAVWVTAGSDGSLPAVTGRYLTRKASRSTVCECRPRPVVTASV